MEITWYGTNSLMIETDGEKIAVDPFRELRGAENPNREDDYLDADTVLITHGHFDHLVYLPELVELTEPTVFCTKTPVGTLEKYCRDTSFAAQIRPGITFPVGKVRVRVLKGRHIRFDAGLIARTFISFRRLKYAGNLPFLIWAFLHYPEGQETLVYELVSEGKRIQILGSLGLNEDEVYRPGADLLIMPYQGNSYLEQIAEEIIHRLRPKRILLTHFDDAFPPFSASVDLSGFRQMMKTSFPDIRVVRPVAGKKIHLQ